MYWVLLVLSAYLCLIRQRNRVSYVRRYLKTCFLSRDRNREESYALFTYFLPYLPSSHQLESYLPCAPVYYPENLPALLLMSIHPQPFRLRLGSGHRWMVDVSLNHHSFMAVSETPQEYCENFVMHTFVLDSHLLGQYVGTI